MCTVNSWGWDPIRIISALLVCPRLPAGTATSARISSPRHTVADLTAPTLFRQPDVGSQLVAEHWAEAVRNASLAVLKVGRDRGQSTHPFYWAGFVAAGDWK